MFVLKWTTGKLIKSVAIMKNWYPQMLSTSEVELFFVQRMAKCFSVCAKMFLKCQKTYSWYWGNRRFNYLKVSGKNTYVCMPHPRFFFVKNMKTCIMYSPLYSYKLRCIGLSYNNPIRHNQVCCSNLTKRKIYKLTRQIWHHLNNT